MYFRSIFFVRKRSRLRLEITHVLSKERRFKCGLSSQHDTDFLRAAQFP
jgi:hypothetical protein